MTAPVRLLEGVYLQTSTHSAIVNMIWYHNTASKQPDGPSPMPVAITQLLLSQYILAQCIGKEDHC